MAAVLPGLRRQIARPAGAGATNDANNLKWKIPEGFTRLQQMYEENHL